MAFTCPTLLGCVLWLGACANARSVPSAPASPRAERAVCHPSAGASLACAARGQSTLALPFQVQRVVGRRAGGAYALGPAGELARVDGRGRLTGLFQTALTSLVATEDYVCGAESSGRVLCARDHHHDRVCSAAALAPLREVGLPHWPGARLISARAGAALCLARAGAEACVPGLAACERACLAFPACAPLRCVDPCPEG